MIKVENLTKAFGAKLAVDNVSFEVNKGEVLGFLGPNGSGKTTTMRMITGFIPPTSGKVSVCGFDMLEDPISGKRRIGYLPESAPSYQEMTVGSFLRFAAEIRGLRGEECKRAVHRAVETCFLESVFNQTIDTLSKGFRHRTCFAQAIIHDPEVLVMDEPTDGLDPNQKYEVRNLIRELGRTKAVVFSTHILEEVDAACTRAIIIDKGRIVAQGTPDELGRPLDEVFRRIEEPGSWVALYNVETHPAYKTFLAEVTESFRPLVEHEQTGICNVGGFIFISAPPSVTPFHIDRENNFWLQIRGRKTLNVWDHTDRHVVAAADVDQFIVYGGLENVRLEDGFVERSHQFDVGPGDGVYFPCTSPHMTRTDPSWTRRGDGVSVSIGVVFYTDQTRVAAITRAFSTTLRERPCW